ncbi:hypothetical protein E4P40_26415 [Blastococcus sp. CT_GayMR20]|uniref:RGCVC family protein n=1 Tax=Blastococcus sp. CT_GayMR20 TaxID=2559609 RepID=UPI001073A916|nr:RGCVC family protein [Blastococcus sp. CT_GayMR20]TFV65398.1 hypothetical protein E4P40_26415 [Blastococcus sp. CT_GayMR20]
MSTTSVPTADRLVDEGLPLDEAAAACAVCPHPLAAHDPISLRFCRATAGRADDATPRGCVCPSS